MSVLVAKSGSGDKCMVASSGEAGGEGEVLMMMLRACRAVVRVCCFLRFEVVAWARFSSCVVRVVERARILARRVGKAGLLGSRLCPRVLASRASGILSRDRRAREDR